MSYDQVRKDNEIEQQKHRKIGIGIGTEQPFIESDVANPEIFYPAMTEKVIERVRGSPIGTTSNQIRLDLDLIHGLTDKHLQTRIIHNVMNDPRTLASVRRSNPDNTIDYYVSYNRE
jgi:hypothetical protein